MKENIRVLLVDDDEDEYVLTRDRLAEAVGIDFDLVWKSTYEAALEAMVQTGYDAYLVDYQLGEQNGLELLREAIAGGCVAPIILLTGQGDHEIDMAAMQAGASDYLDKSQVSAQLLERSIRYAIERKRTQEELLKHREHLEELVEERTTNLRTMVNSMSGREVRMAGLKETIKKLRAQLEDAGLEPIVDDPLMTK